MSDWLLRQAASVLLCPWLFSPWLRRLQLRPAHPSQSLLQGLLQSAAGSGLLLPAELLLAEQLLPSGAAAPGGIGVLRNPLHYAP